ncbi:tagatose-bisphosphate aldolase [Candidatus Campbellbacteria bacterium CG10_big_fil_rev_8_21_14_0_10_35_52]|uniref:Tagatose-bisphosphate aldolase n=1 Tax=Candidatus Campbellbacteria bacterium CG10_big_fil_rev_8_21_14_0_10_35_52 TaxID=1974527 RepID=A0A2M6WUY4_9BACT|nr:MAG: tagatose-bisphosphate aldolase [Candidatus Campbellbacteria bacterium CG10_big_fil_rev_8_21_14_0_10_35_52]
MKTLREIISEADAKKTAIGHFNISDTEMLKGVFIAARNINKPIIIGVSEGERDFIGIRQAAALVKSLREEHNFPIFLNADHTYSFERVKEAIDAGYDAVIFDGAKLPFEENLKITKKCVEYARSANSDILVEGELGYIGKSSKLLDEIPEDVEITDKHLTTLEEIKQFVKKTGVDLIAPAVGNLHGMLKHTKNPNLNIERIKELIEVGGAPMVLHGGSGVSDDDFVKAIDAGISVIHISTEIRVAYKNGIKIALQENPDEIAPYRYMKDAIHNVEKVVKQRLKLFNKI